ncbi:hypothetical protein H6CHR_01616 [Variovorax sp. PBL-H6]|nr:hypothetical protein H6CHR_01616 [Variovorax sp. PBL-H6]
MQDHYAARADDGNFRGWGVTHWRFPPPRIPMYCRTLKYRDGLGGFSMLVEERPDGSLELWELDVPGNSLRRRVVIEKMADSLAREGRKLHVVWGAARVERKRADDWPRW